MTDDELVAAYLRRLRRAARKLPRAQRQELIDHIIEYIAESRSAGTEPGGDTTAALRNAVERLGEPEDIVGAGGGSVTAGRPGGLEIAAVLLLLLGGVFVVGWVVGVILLWISPRWRWPDKLLGTLVWPGGLAGVLLVLDFTAALPTQTCTGTSAHPGQEVCSGWVAPLWLSMPLIIVFVVAPILVAIRLLRRAERQASDPAETVVAGLAPR